MTSYDTNTFPIARRSSHRPTALKNTLSSESSSPSIDNVRLENLTLRDVDDVDINMVALDFSHSSGLDFSQLFAEQAVQLGDRRESLSLLTPLARSFAPGVANAARPSTPPLLDRLFELSPIFPRFMVRRVYSLWPFEFVYANALSHRQDTEPRASDAGQSAIGLMDPSSPFARLNRDIPVLLSSYPQDVMAYHEHINSVALEDPFANDDMITPRVAEFDHLATSIAIRPFHSTKKIMRWISRLCTPEPEEAGLPPSAFTFVSPLQLSLNAYREQTPDTSSSSAESDSESYGDSEDREHQDYTSLPSQSSAASLASRSSTPASEHSHGSSACEGSRPEGPKDKGKGRAKRMALSDAEDRPSPSRSQTGSPLPRRPLWRR